MKISHEQLPRHLKTQFKSIYIVSGDEPLLVQEACDAIRVKARDEGCTERHVWDVANSGFDWQAWLASGRNQSLFSDRQLIELRMPTGKPGNEGGKALRAYAEDVNPDNVLLIVTGKLDSSAQNSRWLKALCAVGMWVTVWPLTLAQMPTWVQRRMAQRGMSASPQAIALLVERVEGNPLAAMQEVEKLYLLYGDGHVSDEAMQDAVVDSARFDIYALVDNALEGDTSRVVRILARLQEEGVEPALLLWALTREVRGLAMMASALAEGGQMDEVLRKFRVWDKRKAFTKKALLRPGGNWQELLVCSAAADGVLKGAIPGDRWDELLSLSLQLAGRPVLRNQINSRGNQRWM